MCGCVAFKMCVCVCVCVQTHLCMHACVCVKERERGGGGDRQVAMRERVQKTTANCTLTVFFNFFFSGMTQSLGVQ